MQDENILAFDTVNDDKFAAGKASQTGTKILAAARSQIGIAGEKKKPGRYGINQAVGNFDAAAFSRQMSSSSDSTSGARRCAITEVLAAQRRVERVRAV